MSAPSARFRLLTLAWLALLALTGASLVLGEWTHAAPAVVAALAAVIWLKGLLVARCFLESGSAHPTIAAMLQVFVALWPVVLVLTSWLGARWVAP